MKQCFNETILSIYNAVEEIKNTTVGGSVYFVSITKRCYQTKKTRPSKKAEEVVNLPS